MALTNGLEIPKEVLDAEIKSFYDSAPPLNNSDDVSEKLEAFVKKNSQPSGTFTFLSLFYYFPILLNLSSISLCFPGFKIKVLFLFE